MVMTPEEQAELDNLRAFKRTFELTPMELSFQRLEGLLERPYSRGFDGVMSVMAFRTIAECLILLKKEVIK
jgi:hypothetical protein